METFDLCILGAGPGGYAAAMRAHDLGKRVALVEPGRVGGAGIHSGALSSKTMWHLSNDVFRALRTDRGYRARELEVSYGDVMAEVREAVDERRALLEKQLARLTAPSAKGGVVTLVQGDARFLSPTEVEVKGTDGSARTITATSFLVATGSTPRVPDGIEVDGERIITSDHIEALPTFPKSMVVVGAGVVGCEYATIFANFGKTKINLIDRQPRILPFEDEDVAEVVATSFEKLGVTIHRESKLKEMRVKDGHVEYVVENPRGEKETILVERALVSVGRAPAIGGLGLEAIGVKVERGAIVADETRTSVPNIYAAGDVTMDVALVNVAELEGRQAVERMFGLDPAPIRYEALSAIMFLKPEVASVGLNETQARAKKVPYKVGKVENRLINRYIAMRETEGFIKLLVAIDEPHRILGLRVVGAEASSAMQGIAFLIDMGGKVADIETCCHPHPAIPEGVQECARAILGRSILKADVFGPDRLLHCAEG